MSQIFNLLIKSFQTDPIFLDLATFDFISALFVIYEQKLVRAGIALMLCFASLALIYFSLGAQFIALSQILIYAVGIGLLIIFSIMLLNHSSDEPKQQLLEKINWKKIWIFITCNFLLLLMVISWINLNLPNLYFLATNYSSSAQQQIQTFNYAIGISLLIILLILFLDITFNNGTVRELKKINWKNIGAFIGCNLLFVLMSISFSGLNLFANSQAAEPRIQKLINQVDLARQKAMMVSSTDNLIKFLLSDQILAFELISVLLLVAFIAAIIISRKTHFNEKLN